MEAQVFTLWKRCLTQSQVGLCQWFWFFPACFREHWNLVVPQGPQSRKRQGWCGVSQTGCALGLSIHFQTQSIYYDVYRRTLGSIAWKIPKHWILPWCLLMLLTICTSNPFKSETLSYLFFGLTMVGNLPWPVCQPLGEGAGGNQCPWEALQAPEQRCLSISHETWQPARCLFLTKANRIMQSTCSLTGTTIPRALPQQGRDVFSKYLEAVCNEKLHQTKL